MKKLIGITGIIFLLASFSPSKKQADAIYYNGAIYTVDSRFTVAEAFAVKDGKILAVGSSASIKDQFDSKQMVDLGGKPVYPGFIDAHCHFYSYGFNLQQVDLVGTRSFDEVVERMVEYSRRNRSPWILGRGWDQNDWDVKEFPKKDTLDALFPSTPIMIRRVDGHAALVNQAALDMAGITAQTDAGQGGSIEKKNGKLTGILIDNAMQLVSKHIPEPASGEKKEALRRAEKNCFAVGLTTVDDAGLEKHAVDIIDEMHKKGELKMRVYAMLNPSESNKTHYYKSGPYKTERLNVRSFKIYADGALGSRGACLREPYSDSSAHYGFLLQAPGYYLSTAKELLEKGFQMNTHCIGDSGNHHLLNVYAEILQKKNDLRWRIEHAQVISPGDFALFNLYSVIPSIQATHCTSDMYWAGKRLGPDRVKGAYAYRDLLKQAGVLAGGSDFPVEDINPLFGFYAAVARKDQKNFPEGGYQVENAITREDALRSMTIWAAYSNFEEKEKGSIEPGKFADFVILEEDIMKIPGERLFSVKVLQTFVNGEKVY